MLFSNYSYAQYYPDSNFTNSSFGTSSTNSKGAIDLLASLGYDRIDIGGVRYTGYNAFLKIFFPLNNNNWYFGFGTRYDSVTSSVSTVSNQQNLFTYQSAQAGLDLAYKLSFSLADLQLNPFIYYSFYDLWERDTTISGVTITSISPIVNNIIYGIGASLLFKIGKYYVGPSAYYLRGYMECDSYTNSYGSSYSGNTGSYEIYNYNLTLGMFL